MRHWSDTNFQEFHGQPLHSEQVTVRFALSRIGIMASWFFEEKDKAITVTSERCIQMIEEFFYPNLKKCIKGMCGSSKTAQRLTRHERQLLLRRHFSDHLISLRGYLE